MLNNTALTLNNLELINYNKLFSDVVSLHSLNETFELNLINSDKLNIHDSMVRRVVTHYIIDSVCSYIIHDHENLYYAFVYSKEQLMSAELFQFCDPEKLFKFIDKTTRKIMKLTGIIFINSSIPFDDYHTGFIEKDGDILDHLIQSIKFYRSSNLNKLFNFIRDQGLIELQQKFFEDYKYKLALMNL